MRAGRRGRLEPVVIDGRDHLTTAQTASYLGVRTQTVYAYVSRGLLRRTTIAGHRGSYFPLAQIEELHSRGRTPRAAGGGERIHTQITLIGADDTLSYRGREVQRLVADEVSYEEVCGLLWGVGEPVELRARPADAPLVAAAVSAMPARARAIDLLKVSVDLLGANDAMRGDLRPEAVVGAGARILGAAVDALALRASADADPPDRTRVDRPRSTDTGRPGHTDANQPRGTDTDRPGHTGSLAGRLVRALGGPATPQAEALLDAVLVLMADHDLAMSTRAARVAASTRAHPYAVVGAALGAMDSPMHGSSPRATYRIVAEAIDSPDACIAHIVESGSAPTGFGHQMYRERDPRAQCLARLLRAYAPEHPAVLATDRLTEAIEPWAQTFGNSDLWLGTLAHVLGWRAEAGALVFMLARTAGWVAHALEEYEAEPLRYRIAGVYVGVRPREDQRRDNSAPSSSPSRPTASTMTSSATPE
ncbi:citrate/2-methylcitrate synthase [Piscicoccus intestinalis]|uniref:citrate/2-methylcitrate synthase n=1 Tax=Piscicoccus intestinalis TaxID=746033 RepID=UPI000A03C23E|nr:citrate/2-methylcitrate synthase [Piscicoccus intestinalis]